ncbi:Methyltransferase domain containing protein [Novymonas esmeraldas]|uniref:tRNA N(3)-methylcytidine methyltransferase n=1 Tax=Novymonas esmeraldas TaxID=1808958 RepID=A0AAW0F7I8_9TRYP
MDAEEPTRPPHISGAVGGRDGERQRKRTRSPPYAPFVAEYRPYSSGQLRPDRVNRYADLHKRQWDLYYRNNTVNGYKDRHYVLREFHELRAAIDAAVAAEETPVTAGPSSSSLVAAAAATSFTWMEAGCGVGNAMLPIFTQYGHLRHWRALLGFDISSLAIDLLDKKRVQLPPELAAKVHLCVLNPSETDVSDCSFFRPAAPAAVTSGASPSSGGSSSGGVGVGDHTARGVQLPEFVSLIFVLCSIPVSCHALVLRRIARCMARPGGVLYFRDYAVSDHAERRFQSSSHRRLGDDDANGGGGGANTYVRTNGTLSHFFSVEEVRALFEGAGFDVIALDIIDNEVVNRKTSVAFARRFVQGRFRLSP